METPFRGFCLRIELQWSVDSTNLIVLAGTTNDTSQPATQVDVLNFLRERRSRHRDKRFRGAIHAFAKAPDITGLRTV